jgi:hypothetical protein
MFSGSVVRAALWLTFVLVRVWSRPYSPSPSEAGSAVPAAPNVGKEVPAMSKNEKKEVETVDITALADGELDDVVGGGDGIVVPSAKTPK